MPELTVRSLQTQELPAIGRMFPGGDALSAKPGFKPTMCRVGVVNGAIVAHALVEPYTLRYGQVRLRTAGISGLEVDAPDMADDLVRQIDYMGTMMRDALAFVAEQGAHLVLLQAPPLDTYAAALYEHFGFNPVWPYYVMEFDSRQAAALRASVVLREARAEDAPQIAAFYEHHWGGRVTFMRSPESWLWRLKNGSARAALIEPAGGPVGGYIAGRDLLSAEVEVVVDSPQAAAGLLAETGRRYAARGIPQVQWLIPPDDVLIVYARQVIDVTVSARYPHRGGWMARLIDTPAMIEALLPEIGAQARVSLPGFDPDELVFDCQPESVRIGLRGRPATFCKLTQREFLQVIFGSVAPATIAISAHLTPESAGLLQALFPPRVAALGCWDWF